MIHSTQIVREIAIEVTGGVVIAALTIDESVSSLLGQTGLSESARLAIETVGDTTTTLSILRDDFVIDTLELTANVMGQVEIPLDPEATAYTFRAADDCTLRLFVATQTHGLEAAPMARGRGGVAGVSFDVPLGGATVTGVVDDALGVGLYVTEGFVLRGLAARPLQLVLAGSGPATFTVLKNGVECISVSERISLSPGATSLDIAAAFFVETAATTFVDGDILSVATIGGSNGLVGVVGFQIVMRRN